MLGMGKLSYHSKIPGRSIPSVYGRYDDALTHHQRARRVTYNGKKLTGEAFTNAIVMHFLELSLDEQEAVLAEYVPQFEGLVNAEPEAADAPAPNLKGPATPTKTVGGKSSGRRKGAG